MADRERGGERSADDIRREIERTRSHMDDTVEAIGDRLSPGRIVDELWHRMRSGQTPAALGDAARSHPLPFTLMGLGLGWLFLEQSRSDRELGAGTYGRAEGRVGPYRGDAVDRDDPEWEHAGVGTKAKAKVSGAAEAVKHAAESVRDSSSHLKESTSEVGHQVAEKARGARATVSHAAHAVRDQAAHAGEAVAERASGAADAASAGLRQGAEAARQGYRTLLDENPLALGAISFGLGLASGISAPTTRWEDEHLGSMSGPLKQRAKQTVQQTTDVAKGAAREAVDAARAELARHKDEIKQSEHFQHVVEDLKDSARDIGRAAEEAAREKVTSGEAPAVVNRLVRKVDRRRKARAGAGQDGDGA